MEKTYLVPEASLPVVQHIVESLVELTRPQAIYLYNRRMDAQGGVTSIKLCVVAPVEDKRKAEKDAYLRIDSEIPFDLLIYTPEEWKLLLCRKDSFASKIYSTGLSIYG